MSDPIVNKVAASGLITINPEEYFPKGEMVVFDLKDYLFMGLILNVLIKDTIVFGGIRMPGRVPWELFDQMVVFAGWSYHLRSWVGSPPGK